MHCNITFRVLGVKIKVLGSLFCIFYHLLLFKQVKITILFNKNALQQISTNENNSKDKKRNKCPSGLSDNDLVNLPDTVVQCLVLKTPVSVYLISDWSWPNHRSRPHILHFKCEQGEKIFTRYDEIRHVERINFTKN